MNGVHSGLYNKIWDIDLKKQIKLETPQNLNSVPSFNKELYKLLKRIFKLSSDQ